jgi:hypothetical protein
MSKRGFGVSANEYSCAHHVTWSPNKLWRSNSIFNLRSAPLTSYHVICCIDMRFGNQELHLEQRLNPTTKLSKLIFQQKHAHCKQYCTYIVNGFPVPSSQPGCHWPGIIKLFPPGRVWLVTSKAVNREDKRSRRYRDRDFAKFERSRRYRDR